MLDALRRPLALASVVVCGASLSLEAQKPALPDVLKAAANYLVEYAERLGAVTAEEEYTQYDTRVASAIKRFQADFVLIGLSDGQLGAFRDVYSIDSNALRPRDGRLLALLQRPPTASVQQEAKAITDEPLIYYVNRNLRALDMPTLALLYLRGAVQGQSAFALDGVKEQGGVQVAVVKFKVNDGTDLLPVPQGATTVGKFWIETATGAVRQTELSISGRTFSFRATAKYSRDAGLGLWVPSELFQQVEISGTVQGVPNAGAIATPDDTVSGARQSVEGRTKYAKYRRLPGTT